MMSTTNPAGARAWAERGMHRGLMGAALLLLVSLPPVRADDFPRVETLELVTGDAVAGDGGNAWGGHQCRIVRTRDGVFTAWTVAGKDDMSREWRLARRERERWRIVGSGVAGREPVNLLASPDGTVHVIGWPDGKARIWSGKPGGDKVSLRESLVPGLVEGHWAYGAAGIDGARELCVPFSEGDKPGAFRWARRGGGTDAWTGGTAVLDYRHCYTYVFPDAEGGATLVSSRDVKWESLGYAKPRGEFDYAFNAFGLWRISEAGGGELRKIAMVEETPTRRDPVAICSAQGDAYVDTKGRIHVIYRRLGASTDGEDHVHYAVFSKDGSPLSDRRVPWSAGIFCRVFQDDRGSFYLLGSDGIIFSGGNDAVSFDRKTRLKLRWKQVEYPGFGLSVPRTGTPRSNIIDFVFPSGGGEKWIYGRIVLHGSN
jgi:hypothetical protein